MFVDLNAVRLWCFSKQFLVIVLTDMFELFWSYYDINGAYDAVKQLIFLYGIRLVIMCSNDLVSGP